MATSINNLQSDKSELEAKYDELNAKYDDFQGKISDYEAGIALASDLSADEILNNNAASDTPDMDDKTTDYTELTPTTTNVPFEKNGVIVVNKKHPLPSTYNPGEDPTARAAADRLVDAGVAAGVNLIHSYSSFRSFSTQAGLFNSYAKSSGIAEAETFSARAGYSEHQTGLAFDLKDSTGNLYKINDNKYNYATDWVALHAAEYGFIVRYRDEWTPITGYVGEPWHLRYLGVDLATTVFNSGKTLEEYLGVNGGEKY